MRFKLEDIQHGHVTEELRDHLEAGNYPKPDDCPGADCPDYRPACLLGICKIAVELCNEF